MKIELRPEDKVTCERCGLETEKSVMDLTVRNLIGSSSTKLNHCICGCPFLAMEKVNNKFEVEFKEES